MRDGPTPIRQQYLKIKNRYPQAIVLFRLGDFYETFDEDARVASRELDIVLTSREMGKGHRVPMAGIPYHALDNYLARLINRGHRVAICEQMGRASDDRGLVPRDVVRVVTPGTVVEPGLLDSKANNYLVALVPGGDEAGIAYVDITTSEFATAQLPAERLIPELERLQPSEVIAAEGIDLPSLSLSAPVTRLDEGWFDTEPARRVLLSHFGVATLEGYGCDHRPLAVAAAGAVVQYLQETQSGALGQLTHLMTYSTDAFMTLDVQTQRNLELFRNSRTGTAAGSLLSVIDLTRTALGGRLLKRWLGQPLLDVGELEKRQQAVGWFHDNALVRSQVIPLLGKMADLERLINRVRGGLATPRELAALRSSLEMIPQIITILKERKGAENILWLKEALKPRPDVVALVSEAIVEQPPSALSDGGVIREGFSEELDKLRMVTKNARQYLANLETRERERTGIKSLKVSYNRVFGYYIEVSKANLAQVPQDYIRKQTLVGGERFFTPELKEYESLILNAQERTAELEMDIFKRVCRQVATAGERILVVATALARVDVFAALAEVAASYGYVRPQVNNSGEIVIREGRHPVVERSLPEGSFVPNDVLLANDDAQLVILTGPNMSGKSTYLRQLALIVLLAQVGSFVPAAAATIGLVDRIFTRIGAQEDIVAGQSTFMVEMVETANILNNATSKSLLILDEIGRGTSTYDGLAIARAVAEYIHSNRRLGAKTLFATHYHELVALADFLPRVKNYNVAVTEEGGEVVFLRKIMPGGVDKSYGIHVAQLAGLPRAVVRRAREVLQDLEGENNQRVKQAAKRRKETPPPQMSFFGPKSPLLEELEKLEIDSLTPLEALTRLYELQKRARQE